MAAASERTITAVFFDFGGTLFSYSGIGAAQAEPPLFVRAAERLGVAADRRTIGRAYGRASKEAFQKIGTQPYYLHRDLFLATFRGFAAHLGAVADDEFLGWFYDGQREMLLSSFALRLDCLETLAALREEGLYLSIVSNIDDDYLHPMVERAGLSHVLNHWTSSEEAQSCKPAPGFFHYALEKADRAAEDVLFVGDSPTHDVAGARALGMTTALIIEEGQDPPGQLGDSPEPHHEIRTLSELLPIVLNSQPRA